eukprot:6185778-Pleurochrysis_carterae.AAC.3
MVCLLQSSPRLRTSSVAGDRPPADGPALLGRRLSREGRWAAAGARSRPRTSAHATFVYLCTTMHAQACTLAQKAPHAVLPAPQRLQAHRT